MKKAFTLIELIVVVTILGILWTLGFMAYSWYAQSARDSARITDIRSIAKVLEIYAVEYNKYPYPTSSTSMTYSWAIVWEQGVFGKSVLKRIGHLNIVPVDPLTGAQYTYSVTQNKRNYQLGTISEGADELAQLSQQTHAAQKTATAIIEWNYYQPIINVRNRWANYILALPSIMNADLKITDVQEIVDQKTLVIEGQKNIPDIFAKEWFNTKAGDQNIVVQAEHLLVHDGGKLDILLSDAQKKKEFTQNIKKAYNNTISLDTNIQKLDVLMKIDMDKNSQIEAYVEGIFTQK